MAEGHKAAGFAELGLFGTVLGVLWLNGNASGHSGFLLLPQLLDWSCSFVWPTVQTLIFLHTTLSFDGQASGSSQTFPGVNG
jgi:hypothetical protein